MHLYTLEGILKFPTRLRPKYCIFYQEMVLSGVKYVCLCLVSPLVVPEAKEAEAYCFYQASTLLITPSPKPYNNPTLHGCTAALRVKKSQ